MSFNCQRPEILLSQYYHIDLVESSSIQLLCLSKINVMIISELFISNPYSALATSINSMIIAETITLFVLGAARK